MERNYDLKMGSARVLPSARDSIPSSNLGHQGKGETQSTDPSDPSLGWDAVEAAIKSQSKEDDLRMFRAVGDEVATPHGRGTVTSVKRGVALIEVGSRCYVEQGQKLTELSEEDIYQLSQLKSTQQDKPMSTKPIPFADLAGRENGDSISCIEGILTSLFDIHEGDSKYGHWVLQGGEMTDNDGDIYKVTFAGDTDGEHPIQPKNSRMKKIRITAGPGKKKGSFAGITMSVNQKEGKYRGERSIKIDNRTTIEFVGDDGSVVAQGDSTHREPQEGHDSGHTPATRSSASPVARKGNLVEGSQATFEHRLSEYRKAFNAVAYEFGKSEEDLLESTVFANIKEIATGLCMSFKGQYGVYADIIWEGGSFEEKFEKEAAQLTEKLGADSGEEPEVKTPPKAAAKAKKVESTWRDFIHPTKKVPLGELCEDSDAWNKTAFWAISKLDKHWETTLPEDRADLIEAQKNIIAGTEDHGPALRDILLHFLMTHKDYGTLFDEKSFMAYLKQGYNVTDLKKMTDIQVKEIIRELGAKDSEALEEIKLLFKKAPVAASEDELPE